MPLDFPNAPFVGQQFSYNGDVWEWDGVAWIIVSLSVVTSPVTPSQPNSVEDVHDGADFPANPNIGDLYEFGGRDYIWDGIAWVLQDESVIVVDWANVLNKPTEFPPEPHQHVEADITDLDKYTQSEIDSFLNAIVADQTIINQALQAGIDANEAGLITLSGQVSVNANAITVLEGRVTQTETDIATNVADIATNAADILTRVRWRGEWSGAITYDENDMVRDYQWTMIANTQTTERPAPQAIGVAQYLYEGTAPTGSETVEVVIMGQQYEGDEPFFVTGYRLYTVAGNRYEVILVEAPGTIDENVQFINSFVASTTGWREFSVARQIIPAGIAFRLLIIVQQPDPAPTITDANYDYLKPTNPSVPATGQIIQSNKTPGVISIHKTDNDATDRSALLTGLKPGDTITSNPATRTVLWSVQAVVDQGTYVDVTVAPATQSNGMGITPFQFSVVVAQPVTLLRDTNWWVSNQPVGGTIDGLYVEDGSYNDVVINSNAYGVDLLVQEAYISPDWDLVALSGDSGSAVPSTDTSAAITYGDAFPDPANPGDLHYLTINPIGLYVYYDDGSSEQWVQANGGSIDLYLPLAGGTMTGDIVVKSDSAVGAEKIIFTDENDDIICSVGPSYVGGAFVGFNFGIGSDSATSTRFCDFNSVEGDMGSDGLSYRFGRNTTTTGTVQLVFYAHNGVNSPEYSMSVGDGTALGLTHRIVTREKGDVRYQSASSMRFKTDIAPLRDTRDLKSFVEALKVKTFKWGGDLPQTDERYGEPAVGLIAEEVEQIFPEAVVYQYITELQGDTEVNIGKRVHGLDPIALIAMLVEDVKDLRKLIINLTARVSDNEFNITNLDTRLTEAEKIIEENT